MMDLFHRTIRLLERHGFTCDVSEMTKREVKLEARGYVIGNYVEVKLVKSGYYSPRYAANIKVYESDKLDNLEIINMDNGNKFYSFILKSVKSSESLTVILHRKKIRSVKEALTRAKRAGTRTKEDRGYIEMLERRLADVMFELRDLEAKQLEYVASNDSAYFMKWFKKGEIV